MPAGRFRYLHWPAAGEPVVFLHGLGMVAEAWQPVVDELASAGHAFFAPDQRAHGQSHPRGDRYDVGTYVADTLALFDALGLDRPHLVGHSMGGRVTMALAARHPRRIRSAAIVDIGPEAWKANWQESVEAFASMPRAFASEDAAIAYASRGRELSPAARSVFLSRLRRAGDGTLTWRADIDALSRVVRVQRSRNYWRDWASIAVPALLVHGARSRELRAPVYEKMRRINPQVSAVEILDVGHNIPLAAPVALADELNRFWSRVSGG